MSRWLIMAIPPFLHDQRPNRLDEEHSAPSSSYQYVVCLSLLWGSYSNPTALSGDHLAWYFPIPCERVSSNLSACAAIHSSQTHLVRFAHKLNFLSSRHFCQQYRCSRRVSLAYGLSQLRISVVHYELIIGLQERLLSKTRWWRLYVRIFYSTGSFPRTPPGDGMTSNMLLVTDMELPCSPSVYVTLSLSMTIQ